MTPAAAAIRAAKNRRRWGGFAALRYAEKNGASLFMYCTALRIEYMRGERNGNPAK
jgi:hypothetical protein